MWTQLDPTTGVHAEGQRHYWMHDSISGDTSAYLESGQPVPFHFNTKLTLYCSEGVAWGSPGLQTKGGRVQQKWPRRLKHPCLFMQLTKIITPRECNHVLMVLRIKSHASYSQHRERKDHLPCSALFTELGQAL